MQQQRQAHYRDPLHAKVDKVIRNRKRNSYAITITILMLIGASLTGYKYYKEIAAHERVESEIAQIVEDESFRRCVYTDSLGKATIGFGHLLTPKDNFKSTKGRTCISTIKAVELLRKDYEYASASVTKHYPWATEEVHAVLTNMTYQLGASGVSKFKLSLIYLEEQDYDTAAAELLNSRWADQTRNRASRLAGRIMSLNK